MDSATLNTYETHAADFAARYAAADLAPLHRLLLAYLPPADRVLEIGCGTGREAAFLTKRGFTVIAADFTTEAGTYAVKRLRQTPIIGSFHSTNPRSPYICIAKTGCAYPIPGIMVGKLSHSSADAGEKEFALRK